MTQAESCFVTFRQDLPQCRRRQKIYASVEVLMWCATARMVRRRMGAGAKGKHMAHEIPL